MFINLYWKVGLVVPVRMYNNKPIINGVIMIYILLISSMK